MKDNKENTVEEEDEFKAFPKSAKFKLFGIFCVMGIINHLGTILVMTGANLLSSQLGLHQYFTVYTSVSTIFSVIIRLINSRICIKVSYKTRIIIVCFWMMGGYLSMFCILSLYEGPLHEHNVLCFIGSFVPCFFLGSAYAFGESAMLAFLRLFPKTLIAGWSSGTGLSGIVSGGLNLLSSQLGGLPLKNLYLFLTPVGPLYLFLFIWSNRILMSKKKLSDVYQTNFLEEDENDELMDPNLEVEDEEDKALEEMNRANISMSLKSFLEVMQMCGRVIINLGFIYLINFFTNSTLVRKNCDLVDIKFLHKTCVNYKYVRKGKYEFINMFFQLGMFTAKTFIKLVRKIQPIEVFTGSIAGICIFHFIQYATGFAHWGVFIFINFTLGFFGGGTYSGAFYTILHSDKVKQDYKELTVNVATLFNDFGTFFSGLFGVLFSQKILKRTEPWKNNEINPPDCDEY